MAKSMQALREEIRRLAINERVIYNQSICIYTRVSWLHLTPTKMGLALHYHGELKLTKWKWKREEIQRGRKGSSHQSQQTSKCSKTRCSSFKLSKMSFPSRKQKKNGQLDTSAKTGGWRKPLTTRRQLSNSGENLREPPDGVQVLLGGNYLLRLAPALCRLALIVSCAQRWLCVARQLLLTFFIFSLLFWVTHLSGFLEQSFQSINRHKNGDQLYIQINVTQNVFIYKSKLKLRTKQVKSFGRDDFSKKNVAWIMVKINIINPSSQILSLSNQFPL